MEQEAHRLERGTTFFNANKELMNKKNWTFNWEIDTIENVGHDYKKCLKMQLSGYKTKLIMARSNCLFLPQFCRSS
jgi:hypothetical protein